MSVVPGVKKAGLVDIDERHNLAGFLPVLKNSDTILVVISF
jgi:hypothetical protein